MEEQRSRKKRPHNGEDAEEQGKRTKVEDKDDLDRYTIGWVCALPKEQTAARAMLDEEFRDVHIRKASNDTNTYTLGSISRHNIVIACLPKGQPGVVRASKVATSMTSTFRNLKFVLMVGIGGGVPSVANDVRLGDVVISTPTGKHPGVVQWDFGKTKHGKFERTGSLNNPPTFLLTALSKMESDHEMEGSKIQENLDLMFNKWPRLKAKYARSDDLEDVLFSANYDHLDNPTNPSLTSGTVDVPASLQGGTGCSYCDLSNARKREVGEPVVHYGLIASGNQVVKDAAFRDDINKNLEGNVLCLEMEAAGLVDDFPCLVIRGICDYADSHKNKAWQEHAAAVAAALTKELLENVPPVEVDSERTVVEKLARELNSNLADIHSTTLATKSELADLGVQAKQNEGETILQWLTPVEYGLQQSDFLRRKQPGTGGWFLASDEYLAWINPKPKANHQTLFCPGIPGAGKTILMATVVDDIIKRFSNTKGVGTAYIYCSFQRRREQTLECFLSSLVKQIARGLATFPNSVAELHKQNKRKGLTPSAKELLDVLRSMSRSFSTLFVLIDALDECEAESRSALLSSLFDLQGSTSTTLKLFATSRFVPEIEGKFSTAFKREIRAADEDICSYIRHQLPQISMNITHLEDKITNEISAVVDGMFLLAQLYLESLKDTTSVREILLALERFKHKRFHRSGDKYELSRVYDQAYEEAMDRIRGQTPNRRELGRRVICWITHAMRPLTAKELQHALAVEQDHDKLDRENVRDVQILLSVCAGLVTVDEESGMIRLVHHTTQEYFDRARMTYFPGDHIMISGVCVRYIWIVCSEGDRHSISWDDESSFPFISYASYGWGYHAARGDSLCEDVERLLLSPHDDEDNHNDNTNSNNHSHNDVDIWKILSSYICQSTSSLRRFPTSAIGWAAYHGITNAIHFLSCHQVMINRPDSAGVAPMVYAAEEQKADYIKVMFDFGADLSHHSQNELLHSVSRSGSTGVLEILIEHGAEIEREDSNRRTPLITAVVANHIPAVRLLLQKGASCHTRGKGGRTPLHEAADFDRIEIAKVLIKHGAQVNEQDEKGQTPLGVVARGSNKDFAGLLLDNGALTSAGSNFGKAPLQVARQDWMARMLIERSSSTSKANVNQEAQFFVSCSRGDTVRARQFMTDALQRKAIQGHQLEIALIIAMRYQHIHIVKLLAEKAAEIDGISTTQQQFCLLCSIETGCQSIAMRLIRKGWGAAPPQGHRTLPNQKRPLVSALEHGYANIAKLLIEEGSDIHGVQGLQDQTILLTALYHGHSEIAKLLIEKGAVLDGNQGPHGTTALFRAISEQLPEVVGLLLDKGVKVNGAQGPEGKTPLFQAANLGDRDIVELLLKKGAVVNGIQGPGRTSAIYSAIRRRHYDVTELLMRNGARLNGHEGVDLAAALSNSIKDNRPEIVRFLINNGPSARDGRALTTAYEHKRLAILEILLDEGADPNDSHVLTMACRLGQCEVLELMLAKGASTEDSQLLIEACKKGNIRIIKLLLEHGANADNSQVLYEACSRGNSEVVKVLLERGADTNNSQALIEACRRGNSLVAEMLLEGDADVEPSQALIEACRGDCSRIIRMLLEGGADAKNVEALLATCQPGGLGALDVLLELGSYATNRQACIAACEPSLNHVLDYLLKKSENFFLARRPSSPMSRSRPIDAALHWACVYERIGLNIIRLILDNGADVNATDTLRRTALFGCDEGTVQLLIDRGINIEARDLQGRTALLHKPYFGKTRLLLDNGADVNATDNLRRTALFECDESTAQLLIDRGINIEVRDLLGWTALLHACHENLSQTYVNVLIDRGANVHATDHDPMNPLDHACLSGDINQKLAANIFNAGGRLPQNQTAANRVLEHLKSVAKRKGWIPPGRDREFVSAEQILEMVRNDVQSQI